MDKLLAKEVISNIIDAMEGIDVDAVYLQRLLSDLNVPEEFLKSVSHDVASYLSLKQGLKDINFGELRLLGTSQIFEHGKHGVPGCVVSSIGMVPLATEEDGSEYFVRLDSSEVFLLPFEWFDDMDPSFLQESYSSEFDVSFERKPMSLDNIRLRNPVKVESLTLFLSSLPDVVYT